MYGGSNPPGTSSNTLNSLKVKHFQGLIFYGDRFGGPLAQSETLGDCVKMAQSETLGDCVKTAQSETLGDCVKILIFAS